MRKIFCDDSEVTISCFQPPRYQALMDNYSNSSYQQQYAQQQQAAYDINPYYKPYQGPSFPIPGSSSTHSAPIPANAYEYDVGILAQQSVYVPGAMIDKRGGAGGKLAKGGKRTTVLRKGGGKVWEDQTLLEWSPCKYFFLFMLSSSISLRLPLAWFRLFVGDLSNDVSDDVLANAFNKYTSFQKARVIRDRLSQKVIPCLLNLFSRAYRVFLFSGQVWVCGFF